MAVIPVVEWNPDAAPLGVKGAPHVKNVLPGTNSYKPFPRHETISDALSARPRGAIDVRDRQGNGYQFVGTAATLEQASSTSWTDVSKTGGYATGTNERWEFIAWKNQVIATNFDDNIQTIELGAGNFADLTTDFRCRHLAVIGDYIVAANTFDSTDGFVSDRVRTCQFNDETNWTVSPQLGSIARELKGGPIQRVLGGEYGIIFTQKDTYRMDFVGAPSWFQIPKTLPDVGILAPGAVARIGDVAYAWSSQGFVAITAATGFVGIGAGRVDRFAFQDLDDTNLDRISAVADPQSGRIFWAYPGQGNMNGTPNRIICYDKNFDRWSYIEDEIELLWAAGGIGFTLEQLDSFAASIDDLAVTLDSSQWKGDGDILLAGFDDEFKHGFFSGMAMDAEVDVRELELNDGKRTMLQSYRPLVDGGSVDGAVGYRNNLSDPVTYTTRRPRTSTGRVTQRSNARYHRFRLYLTGEWKDVIGVQVDAHDARPVGYRG